MSFRGMWRLFAAVSLVALAITGAATASDEGTRHRPQPGRQPGRADAAEQGRSDAAPARRRQVRHRVQRPLSAQERQRDGHRHRVRLRGRAGGAAGCRLRARHHDRGPGNLARAHRGAPSRREGEKQADAAALADVGIESHEDEIVVLRVDYFESYAGRFLSVEAKTRLATVAANGAYTGPTLSLSFNSGPGAIDSPPRTMSVNIDPDTTPDTYIEHRELVRIGDAGTTSPAPPTQIRIGSSTGESVEAPVNVWLGGGLPPMKDDLPEGLHDQLHGSDRGLPAAGRAGGRVPRHLRADHAAEQDERLPAQGDGEHERHDAAGNSPAGGTAQSQTVVLSRAPGATRAATTSRRSSAIR